MKDPYLCCALPRRQQLDCDGDRGSEIGKGDHDPHQRACHFLVFDR